MKKSLSYLVSLIGHILFWFKREAYLPLNGDWYGLGNRIKGIANFYQLGYRKFTLIWNTKSWVTDSFNSLFCLKDCIIHEITSAEKKYGLYTKIFRRFLPLGVIKEECPFWSFILPRRFHYENLKHKWSFSNMEREAPDTLFFISAMNDEIASLFKARFKGRVIELPNKCYSSMVDAVADMWLLGHCAKMIVSPGSTFSEVAWWWGGAKIPVVHLKSEYNQASS